MSRKWLLGLGTLGWSGFSKKVPQHCDGHVTKGGRKKKNEAARAECAKA